MDMITKSAIVFGGIAAVNFGLTMGFIVKDATKKYEEDCDYLMILGGNIIGAETPSRQLVARMEKAVGYLETHPNTIAISCGGCFREGQKKSEAQIIKEYLTANGIEENRIFLEDKSTTTIENFRLALPIIKNISGKEINELNIGFLTSSYHIFRSTQIAKCSGLKTPKRVAAPTPDKAIFRYIREYFAFFAFVLDFLKK
jgi:uncharacterized SAM-binding protein YcdF (DUF218 family)